MNLVWTSLIIVGLSVVFIAAMLLVRRRAPDGSYFNDGDRAAGVFGVLATGFSVLLGFIVFLTFSSYDSARAGAEAEARIVAQQVETAQLFPRPVSAKLTSELVCYAHSVVGVQWDRMRAGTLGEQLNPWGVQLFRTFQTVDPKTASEQAAYSKWLDQTSDREEARQDRIHGAIGIVPTPLWLVLLFISGIIFVYTLFFADSGEPAFVQALMMGSIVAVVVSMLLLLQFLDHPFHPGIGGLGPKAMQRTLLVLDQELRIANQTGPLPCDARGNAR